MAVGLYAKAVVAAVVAALTTALTGLADNGHLSLLEWVAIIAAFVANLGALIAVVNTTDGLRRYLKAIIAGAVAGLASLGAALSDGGISTTEIISILLAILGTVVPTAVAPNAVVSEDLRPRRAA